VARMREIAADIAAQGSHADHCDSLAHPDLPRG
jgi:hypothetical protein